MEFGIGWMYIVEQMQCLGAGRYFAAFFKTFQRAIMDWLVMINYHHFSQRRRIIGLSAIVSLV
jgi:uncharacterized membrane protein